MHKPSRYTTNSQDGGQSNPRGTKKSEANVKGIGYTISNDTEKEEGMNTTSLQELSDNAREHASEPILERKSDSYGLIRVYPPAAAPSEWDKYSWLLTTEYDTSKNPPGISVRLKAQYVTECYERPHFILDKHKFVDPA